MSVRLARRVDGLERTLIRRIFDAAPADAINLGLGQPDLPSPDPVREAGVEAIREGRTGYTSTAGDPELRAAVAATYPGYVDGPEGVVVTVGTQEALFAAFLVLLDPGDEILVPDPGYPAYRTAARLIGARPRSYPLRSARAFRLDAADVLERVGPRTRAVLVCSPSNPTGAVHESRELHALAEGLAARGVPWISDEIYAAFCYDGPLPVLRTFAPNAGLTIGGVSKDLSMTGWRIGWLAGPTATIERAVAVHQHLVTCAPSVSQRAALAAFGAAGRRARSAMVQRFRARRDRMGARLDGVPRLTHARPDGAFYYFVRVDGCTDSEALCRGILDEVGVVTIPGIAFGEEGEGWVRLSYAADEADIDRGVARIADALRRR